MALDVNKTQKAIKELKSTILRGYEYIDSTPNLGEHIKKSILKRIDADEVKLDKLEIALRKSISDKDELLEKALFSVRNNW